MVTTARRAGMVTPAGPVVDPAVPAVPAGSAVDPAEADLVAGADLAEAAAVAASAGGK